MPIKVPSLFEKAVLWWPGSNVSTTIAAKTLTVVGHNIPIQNKNSSDPWGGSIPVGWANGTYTKGVPNSIKFPASPDMIFTGDFTIELWIKVTKNQLHPWPNIINNRSDADWDTNLFSIIVDGQDFPNVIRVGHYSAYTGGPIMVSTTNMIDSVWHHVAVVRYNSTGKVYIDGNEEATYSNWTATVSFNLTVNEIIGKTRTGQTVLGPCFMSNYRISNIARYTGEFTVPSGPFVNDVYTRLLLKMNGSGNTFVDSSGYVDYDCFPIVPSGVTVANNGTWTKSELGNSKTVMVFNGIENYIQLSSNVDFEFGTGDYSICFWVKRNAYDSQHECFTVFADGVSTGDYWSWSIYQNKLSFYDGSTTPYQSTTLFADGSWYYCVVVRISGVVYVYINSAIDGSSFADATSLLQAGFRIGMWQTANPIYMNGIMKDLMLFKNRALTQAEITALMRLTHPITGPGIIPGPYDYWRLS